MFFERTFLNNCRLTEQLKVEYQDFFPPKYMRTSCLPDASLLPNMLIPVPTKRHLATSLQLFKSALTHYYYFY